MATSLEDLELLQAAEQVCDSIWHNVQPWSGLARDTIGQQLVRAADSIGANIAESYGRYNYGEKIQFLYYARGSLYETKYWLRRTLQRKLLTDESVTAYSQQLDGLAKGINVFIVNLRRQRSTGRT